MSKKIYCQPLVFAKNYYIHVNGYVFYLNTELPLLPEIRNGDIKVKIKGKYYSLFNLMIEYFNLSGNKFTYNTDKNKPLRIPLRLIKVVNDDSLGEIDNDYFNCQVKARKANSRSKDKISKSDVLFVLKRDDYKCVYCDNKVKKNNFHLDHVKPLSKGGKNVKDNLATSCKTCNLMKHSMIKKDFIERCRTIHHVNNLKKIQKS